MDFVPLKAELKNFYNNIHPVMFSENKAKAEQLLNEKTSINDSGFVQKGMQYEILAECYEPILFENTSFYFEMASVALYNSLDWTGNYTYNKNKSKYRNSHPELLKEKDYCTSFPLYQYIGEYGDEQYHFSFNPEPVLKGGFVSLYETAQKRLSKVTDQKEKDFFENMIKGLLAIKRIGERFCEKAKELSNKAESPVLKEHYIRIAKMAERTPWNKPSDFEEALNTFAFIQCVIPMLEGGIHSGMGRLDYLLYPFYENDIREGIITKEYGFKLVTEFLLIWDAHVNRDRQNQNDSLESAVYTLGGCDAEGKPVCNDLTLMFLTANREQDIIYPKIKCRFGFNSPQEYLEEIARDLKSGRSTLLLENDDKFIPALVNNGVEIEDARNYSMLGCWEPVIPNATNEHCAYLNLLKIFELSCYDDFNREDISVKINSLGNADSFDEVYKITVDNIRSVIFSRCKIASVARKNWVNADPHMLMSAAIPSCMKNAKDVTDGGAKYNLDEIIVAGFPNVVDSLLAIKELCFEKQICTVAELLNEVKNNWQNEDLHKKALSCKFFGDETKESNSLINRLSNDIADIGKDMPVAYGGKVTFGYMLFMEMYRYAAKMRATPDGRKNGDFFSRGLTPSILHHIPSVMSAINTLNSVDTDRIAANGVLNITVPFNNLSLENWVTFIRGCAVANTQALQLNCVSKEELEDALIHPEKHRNIVVRVCGYSAKFTLLPDYVQKDFLSRNFFDK